jgi:hypothetical protein
MQVIDEVQAAATLYGETTPTGPASAAQPATLIGDVRPARGVSLRMDEPAPASAPTQAQPQADERTPRSEADIEQALYGELELPQADPPRDDEGRAIRKDAGNVYDHYNIAYEYPGGVTCHMGQRQYPGLHSEVVDRIHCEKGTVICPNLPMALGPDGKKRLWMYRPEVGVEQNMYQVCHNEFFAALRKGESINAGEYMANSTMLGILGREAAHTGLRITWDEIWNKTQDMAPDTLGFGDEFPIAPVPVPGVHKLT